MKIKQNQIFHQLNTNSEHILKTWVMNLDQLWKTLRSNGNSENSSHLSRKWMVFAHNVSSFCASALCMKRNLCIFSVGKMHDAQVVRWACTTQRNNEFPLLHREEVQLIHICPFWRVLLTCEAALILIHGIWGTAQFHTSQETDTTHIIDSPQANLFTNDIWLTNNTA